MDQKLERTILFNSINVAVFLCANCLSWVLKIEYSIVFVVAFCASAFLISGNSLLQKRILPITLYILAFFLFSFFITDSGFTMFKYSLTKYFLEFVACGIFALIISQIRIDVNKVILTISVISFIIAPLMTSMAIFGETDYGQLMGYSYGSLPLLLAIVYALFFINTKKIFKVLLCLPLFILSLWFITSASRGAILSAVFFLYLSVSISLGVQKKRIVAMLAIIGFVAYLLFIPLVEFLSDLLYDFGIQSFAIDKILMFMSHGEEIDNGRSSLLEEGLKMFMSSPIFGNGVAAFEREFGGGYVHNFLVQQLLEGGILLFVPLTVLLVKAINVILSLEYDNSTRLFLAYLLCSSVIGLLFSSYYWRTQGYWYLMGLVILLQNNEKLSNN